MQVDQSCLIRKGNYFMVKYIIFIPQHNFMRYIYFKLCLWASSFAEELLTEIIFNSQHTLWCLKHIFKTVQHGVLPALSVLVINFKTFRGVFPVLFTYEVNFPCLTAVFCHSNTASSLPCIGQIYILYIHIYVCIYVYSLLNLYSIVFEDFSHLI